MKKINNNGISEILFPTVTLFIVIAIMLIVGAGAFVTPYRSGDGEEYIHVRYWQMVHHVRMLVYALMSGSYLV